MKSLLRDNRAWLVLFLAVLALLGTGRWRFPRQSGGFTPIAHRPTAPDLTLPLLDGAAFRLADHRGQIVLINYWATWCEPCREELPGLAQLARSSTPNTLAIVGVSLDTGPDAPSRVRQFVAHYRVPYPVAFPSAAMFGASHDIGLPTTVLIDRHGRIAKTYTGAVERDDFQKDIATLLAES